MRSIIPNLTYNLSIGVDGARKMAKDIEVLLKEKHFIAPDDTSALRTRSVFENVEQNMAFANVLQLIVLFIGIGTLFAGAIGIGNIMVFVVQELPHQRARYKEVLEHHQALLCG
ncbi:MAG: hypothetical protein U5K51_15575 [Flavobacteriaceae bacterium]|nr:hypothetical protein [Flavobacteriaceae bacterium]